MNIKLRNLKMVFIILVLICSMGCSLKKVNTNTGKIEIDYTNFLSDLIANSSGKVFFTDKDSIVVFDENTNKTDKIIIVKNNFITNLCIEDDKIFAIDPFNKKLIIVSTTGKIISEKPFKIEFQEIHKIRKVGDALLVLGYEKGEETQGHSLSLYSFSLNNSDEKEIDIKDINNFCTYEKNNILVLVKSGGQKIINYNMEKGFVENEFVFAESMLNEIYVSDFEYNTNNKEIIYIGNKTIYSIKLDSTSKDTIINKSNNIAINSKIALSKDYIYTLNPQTSMLEKYSSSPIEHDKNTLITYVSDNSINKSFEENNGVKIISNSPASLGARDKLAIKILAGDADFDVYEINASVPNSYYLIKNEVYFDLGSSEIIKNYISGTYDVIKESSYHNGKLFGLPISCLYEVMYYDENLLKNHNLSLESLVSWKDFFDSANKVVSNRTLGNSIFSNNIRIHNLILDQYINSYCDILNGKLDFNTDDFREALALMKKANQETYLQSGGVVQRAALVSGAVFSINNGMFSNFKDDTNFTYIPVINQNKKIKNNISLTWLAINPNSRNKDLAIKYIEHQTKNIRETSPMYRLSKSLGNNQDASKIWSENHNKLMSNGQTNFEFNIYNAILPILGDYFSDKIDVVKASENINEKVKMIINE